MTGHETSFTNPSLDAITRLLHTTHRIAVVGLSNNTGRPSYHVASYLKDHGYEIVPVHPRCTVVFGQRCYASLDDIPGHVDVVDVFLRPDAIDPIVDAAVRIRAGAIWLQDGVVNEAAARKAVDAGLLVVMNRCMLRDHAALRFA